jgi:hypothetical protein
MVTAKISCTDAYIGQNPTIIIEIDGTITGLRVEWQFGSQSGIIAGVNYLTRKITFWQLPTSFYAEIPNAQSGVGALTLEAQSGGEVVAEASCTFTARVSSSTSAPTISLPQVKDVNPAAVALTGDDSKLIRHVSTAKISAKAQGRNSATIVQQIIENEDVGYEGEEAIYECIASEVFYIVARDSRGLTTRITYTVPAERIVEYIRLTCNAGNETPDTDGKMTAKCSGNYFQDSFGQVENELTVEYRYKERGGEWGAWSPMTANIYGNKYSATADIEGLNYQTKYVFEYRATDKVRSVTSAEADAQGVPVFHWSETDFVHETPVNFKKGLTIDGKEIDFVVE